MPTLSVHTYTFSDIRHWPRDADGNADAGKSRIIRVHF